MPIQDPGRLATGGRGVTRRQWLEAGTLLLAAARPGSSAAEAAAELRIGLVTDLHYADKPAAGRRRYRQTPAKLAEAAENLTAERIEILVALGDLIDSADTVAGEQQYLETIHRELAKIGREQHYVLGNHCVERLEEDEFLGVVGQERASYSFDRAGVHFLILDACFREDGTAYGRRNFKWTDANIPAAQLEWLEADLADGKGPAIVLVHQRLDETESHSVRNAARAREVLERSRRVVAVFQGHSHHNDLQEIGGIRYCTLAAMVEGEAPEFNAYAVLRIAADGSISVQGFRRQRGYDWPA